MIITMLRIWTDSMMQVVVNSKVRELAQKRSIFMKIQTQYSNYQDISIGVTISSVGVLRYFCERSVLTLSRSASVTRLLGCSISSFFHLSPTLLSTIMILAQSKHLKWVRKLGMPVSECHSGGTAAAANSW